MSVVFIRGFNVILSQCMIFNSMFYPNIPVGNYTFIWVIYCTMKHIITASFLDFKD